MNTPTILQQIVLDKRDWLAEQQTAFPLAQFQSRVVPSDRDFYAALREKRPCFILECKKASPSKGLIRADFDLDAIASVYQHYAAAISVLTDEKYFQGDFAYIQRVRAIAAQPVLCKDFIVDPYQVWLARHHQADAILLMLSVLDDATYQTLADLAHALNMGVLTETSTPAEVARAVALGAKVIGINNRNLHDLSVDVARTPPLAAAIPDDRLVISESGIHDHRQVHQLQAHAHGFLIGSSLMGSADLNHAVRRVIFGENKVCGLTRAADVAAAYDAGALYGGLIFAENSPRRVSLEQAQALVQAAPLAFVGVFQNQSVDHIADIARALNLFAVQLHGDEDAAFIDALRGKLPPACHIWRAVGVDTDAAQPITLPDHPHIERYVLDSRRGAQQGGTGTAFDWTHIPHDRKARIMLAGGINADNIDHALAQNCLGLDLNSGAESAPGIKDHGKLATLFRTIHKDAP
ncbi:MAG: bifunctional indole-3-glycerol-phosphate synthase TrpC/phosphoribosylanthranilate isomerase TrpF [Cardiobacteriaceae bacterium]|nr:bifunctional indole-3-glycerol-phosphate synthase TrpC/phosphoribosylanthranilate isomerase TrpF [Cardiobacteriaceae bacterium]